MATDKKMSLFAKITNREDAIKVVKDSSVAFFAVAAIKAGLSFLVGLSILIDAAIYVVAAFFLRRYNSRTAAIALLALATISAGVTFANKAGANLSGGNNIILALIVLWASIRAVQATFMIHGKFASSIKGGGDAT
jgi:hypothetical protein